MALPVIVYKILKQCLILPLLWLPMIFMPLRWLFDFFTIYHPDLFRSLNTQENHDKKVQNVQNQIKKWNESGRKTKMCTGRPGWQTLSLRQLDKSKMTRINLDLEDIIEIDVGNKVLRVEPGIKIGTLTHKLLQKGLTIPLVPELETLTVGGLINGLGVETSSHKYGFFADTCIEFEVVLGDGSKVFCSKTQNSEIFHAIPMSHGTVGFLTGVTLPLIPAKKYVKVEYVPSHSLKNTKTLLEQNLGKVDFVEGIVFDANRAVVMYGNLTDTAEPGKVYKLNRWYEPFFYSHVKEFVHKRTLKESFIEYIPLRDYYHRHQRGHFWEVTSAIPLLNSRLFLYLFGWFHPINFQLNRLICPKFILDFAFSTKYHVLQDFEIPMTCLEDFLKLVHEEVEMYPLWLCPTNLISQPGLMHPDGNKDEMYIDIGIYGNSEKNCGSLDICIKNFENFCLSNKGFQFLYADTYLTKEEFRRMFDLKQYDQIRELLGSHDAFPDVYDKISIKARK